MKLPAVVLAGIDPVAILKRRRCRSDRSRAT
jgi:hypothetical protein